MRHLIVNLAVGALTPASLSQPTFAAPVTERISFSTTSRGYYGSINGIATVTFDPAATVSAGPTGAMVAISGLPGAYTGPWYVDYLPVTKQVSIGNFCGADGCIAQAGTNSVALGYHVAPGGGLDTSFYPALLAYGVTDPLVSNIVYLSGLTLTVEQIATPSTQVPEPASLTLLGSVMAALGCSRSTRRAALSLCDKRTAAMIRRESDLALLLTAFTSRIEDRFEVAWLNHGFTDVPYSVHDSAGPLDGQQYHRRGEVLR